MTTTNNNQETLRNLMRSARLTIHAGQDIIAASEALEHANAELWVDDMAVPPGLALIYEQRDHGEGLVRLGEALELRASALIDEAGMDMTDDDFTMAGPVIAESRASLQV
jgi:hypothetical protein